MSKPLDPEPYTLHGERRAELFTAIEAYERYTVNDRLVFNPRPEYEQDRSKYAE